MPYPVGQEEGAMTESTKTIASLKKAANYTKLAMRKDGPRSFKRGQGALIKVIHKFGQNDSISKDEAKKVLGWRGCDVRDVAKKAADNGYLTIDNPKDGFQMTLTQMGAEVVQKRLQAEDKAADAVLSGLSAAEKKKLGELCDKISMTAEEMGVDYATIQKKRGRKCACKEAGHGKGEHCKHDHGHDHDHGPKYVFVFKEGGHDHDHDHGESCKHHKH